VLCLSLQQQLAAFLAAATSENTPRVSVGHQTFFRVGRTVAGDEASLIRYMAEHAGN
jgi:hypothetical protein